jgi:hypothetical protein
MAAAGCFRNPPLDSHNQHAMLIYFMAAQLKAIGGTDYTTSLSTTLMTDARCLHDLTPGLLDAIAIVIEENNANSAGAALSTNIQTLMQSIKCLKNVPEDWMFIMELYLRCQLGRGKAYPQ